MTGIADLIEVFRGEGIKLNPFRKRWGSLMNAFGKARVGKYSTTAAKEAMEYASRKFPNKILKAMITPLELKIGQKMFHELEPDYTDEGVKTKRIRKKISDFIRDKGGRNYNLLSTKNKNNVIRIQLKQFKKFPEVSARQGASILRSQCSCSRIRYS